MSKKNKVVRDTVLTLTEKVAVFKLAARESLRMELISPRLAKVNSYENQIKNIAENKASREHEIKVCAYEMSKLDTDHPDFEDRKEAKEDCLESLTKSLEGFDKETKAVEEAITEQKEKIQDIEHGETKVSAEALNDLVADMIDREAIISVGK